MTPRPVLKDIPKIADNNQKNGNNKSDKQSDEIENTTKHVTDLKSKIYTLKKKNMRKINTLVIVHLKELNDLRMENNKMKQELIRSKHEFNVT